MNMTAKRAVCGVVGLVLGLFGAWLARPVQSTNTTSVVSVATSTSPVIDAVYPLFTTGISWTSKVQVTLPPQSNYNPTDQTIAGYQATSLPSASTVDIGATVEPLRNYYDQLLVKNGWAIDPKFEADGAGGSLWGFAKGSDILILSYTSAFMNQQPNQPEQCPCTIVFTIIGGTLK